MNFNWQQDRAICLVQNTDGRAKVVHVNLRLKTESKVKSFTDGSRKQWQSEEMFNREYCLYN